MAEFVNQRVESYIPIFEHVSKLNLLTKREVKFTIERLKDFEYKIQKQTRTIEDVIKYAKYIADMVVELGNQRKKEQNFKLKREIEGELKNKIYSLFGVYTRIFGAEIEYWQQSMKILAKLKSRIMLNKAMEQFVQHMGKTHKLSWRQAIEYFYNTNKDGPIEGIKTARIYMQRCIRAFQQDLQVYLWGLKLELKHEEFLFNMKLSDGKACENDFDVEKERSKCLALARMYYTSAKEHCWAKGCTVDLFRQFFLTLDNFNRCEELQNLLRRDLQANCSSEEETYEVLAHQEVGKRKWDVQESIRCLEMGLKATPTMKMYDVCANLLLSLLRDDDIYKPKKINREEVYGKLIQIMQDGHKNDKLSAESYAHWIEAMLIWRPVPKESQDQAAVENNQQSATDEHNNMVECQLIVQMALTKYPDNGKLMAYNVRILTKTKPKEILSETIRFVSQNHGFNEMLFYDQFIMNEALADRTCCEINVSKDPLKSLLNIKSHPYKEKLLAMQIKSFYLQGFGFGLDVIKKHKHPLRSGLENARTAFETIKGVCNYYPVYKEMAKIEFCNLDKSAPDPLGRVRNIMETAALHFGSTSIEFWKDYISYEKRFQNKIKVAELEARAKRTLTRDLAQRFLYADALP